MVIEWLTIRVSADQRERYIRIDDDIWTPALKQYPGFISKETWISSDDAELIIFVIRWASREQWKAIPEAELDEITARFDQTFAADYSLEVSTEYQVRRFPVSAEATG